MNDWLCAQLGLKDVAVLIQRMLPSKRTSRQSTGPDYTGSGG